MKSSCLQSIQKYLKLPQSSLEVSDDQHDVVNRVEADPSSTQRVPKSTLPTHSWPPPSSLQLLLRNSPQSLHKSCLTTARKLTCESIDIVSLVLTCDMC